MNASVRLAHTRSAIGRILKGGSNANFRKRMRDFAERGAARGESVGEIHAGLLTVISRRHFSGEDKAELLKGLERDLPAKEGTILEGVARPVHLAKWDGPAPVGLEGALELSPGPRSDCWLQIASGREARLDKPNASDIAIEDVAFALARICRFGGHVREHVEHYSVAQHSLLVMEMCPPELRLVGLLHDAAEAYLGDVVRPLKQLLPSYKVLEKRWALAIGEAFGLGTLLAVLPESVKFADQRALATERRDVQAFGPARDRMMIGDPPAHPLVIVPMLVRRSQERFLQAYHGLRAEMAAMVPAERPVYLVPDFEGRIYNEAYLAEVRNLRMCSAALSFGSEAGNCQGVTEADHAGEHPRGRKANDDTAIPMCSRHHRQRTDYKGIFKGWDGPRMRAWCDRLIVETQAIVFAILRQRAEGKAAS